MLPWKRNVWDLMRLQELVLWHKLYEFIGIWSSHTFKNVHQPCRLFTNMLFYNISQLIKKIQIKCTSDQNAYLGYERHFFNKYSLLFIPHFNFKSYSMTIRYHVWPLPFGKVKYLPPLFFKIPLTGRFISISMPHLIHCSISQKISFG